MLRLLRTMIIGEEEIDEKELKEIKEINRQMNLGEKVSLDEFMKDV